MNNLTDNGFYDDLRDMECINGNIEAYVKTLVDNLFNYKKQYDDNEEVY